jgi:hypothetical protein
MNTIEDRLRAALEARAETFSADADADAWQRINAKGARSRRMPRRMPGRKPRRRLAVRATFLLPTAAAAAVVAVILGATALGHGFTGAGSADRGGGAGLQAPGGATRLPGAAGSSPGGPADRLLATDPPVSAIIQLGVTHGVTTWAWIGEPSPLYWFPGFDTSLQFCHWTAGSSGEGSGNCWSLPRLSTDRPAAVIDNNDMVGTGHPVLTGVAETDATSVTAVLPDGQRFRGVIGAGRGFPVKAWSVTCPTVNGTKLIFTAAAGQPLATLSTAAPVAPRGLDIRQPAVGGVALFRYPPNGTVDAYLLGGHVAFFGPFGGAFSPAAVYGPPADGGPAVAGIAQGFGHLTGSDFALLEAFGYANQDVAKVVVQLPDGGQVTAPTLAAGWPASDVRLWQVSLPLSAWKAGGVEPKLIAVGYNAAGQVVGRSQLGQLAPG